jgi:hypothetical protein
VVERAALSVVRAWPAANMRIRNRQCARLLLQFPAAGSLRALGLTACAASTMPAFQFAPAGTELVAVCDRQPTPRSRALPPSQAAKASAQVTLAVTARKTPRDQERARRSASEIAQAAFTKPMWG